MAGEPAGQDGTGGEQPQHRSREEWLYLYMRGLEPARIAQLCRVPKRTIETHLRTRLRNDPGLFGWRLMLHDRPALPPASWRSPRPRWDELADRLEALYRAFGRMPRAYSKDKAERTLANFLARQREEHRAGTLDPDRKERLDRIPGWLTPPKQERENRLWEQRLGELAEFVAGKGRMPYFTSVKEPQEKVLATWVTRQRHLLRTGDLSAWRTSALEGAVPGWQGRKPSGSPVG